MIEGNLFENSGQEIGQEDQQVNLGDSGHLPKWFNSPTTFHTGTLQEIIQHIPDFERHDFALPQTDKESSRLNGRLDMIIRKPFGKDKTFIPIGVVSKEYTLVPHTSVLSVATKALDAAKIALADVEANLEITEYGERISLSLFLPDKYDFDPGDGHPMSLRLEITNSVDGSTRFRALMGWFRLVCSNGLIIGVTRLDVCRRHVGNLFIEEIGDVLSQSLMESEKEKKNIQKWYRIKVNMAWLTMWVDKKLKKEWGFKAATRALHIAKCGHDVEIVGKYMENSPSTIEVRKIKKVPGAPEHCMNLFDLSQILAWLARERRDVQERLAWREQISGLMNSFIRGN